jgi:hypothetical protein
LALAGIIGGGYVKVVGWELSLDGGDKETSFSLFSVFTAAEPFLNAINDKFSLCGL